MFVKNASACGESCKLLVVVCKNVSAFTLMLERRSFLRTSLLMSLTATDSSCW